MSIVRLRSAELIVGHTRCNWTVGKILHLASAAVVADNDEELAFLIFVLALILVFILMPGVALGFFGVTAVVIHFLFIVVLFGPEQNHAGIVVPAKGLAGVVLKGPQHNEVF